MPGTQGPNKAIQRITLYTRTIADNLPHFAMTIVDSLVDPSSELWYIPWILKAVY